MQFGLIFITSCIATVLSSMSGGGSSIIALPVFLSMGIPFPLATAMQKVSACFWVLPSARNYLKGRKIDWRFLILFAALGTIGAYLGVLAVVSVNQRILRAIIGAIILALVVYIYFKKDAGLKKEFHHSKGKEMIAYAAALPMGFYESLLGSGNGVAFAALSFYAKGFDLIDALGYYFAAAFPWVVLAAIVLMQKGFFAWQLVIPAVLGSFVGGYAGSKFARFKGNKFIKLSFVIVGGVLGMKLMLGL